MPRRSTHRITDRFIKSADIPVTHRQPIDLFHNAFCVDSKVPVKIADRAGLAKIFDPYITEGFLFHQSHKGVKMNKNSVQISSCNRSVHIIEVIFSELSESSVALIRKI